MAQEAPLPVVVQFMPGFEAEASDAARSLGLPSFEVAPEGALVLVLNQHGWGLTDGDPKAGVVRADFLDGTMGRRLREAPRGEGRIARALGLKGEHRPFVADATAGLGRETMIAAALGCRVVAFERSPVVALLLRDGLERAAAGGMASVTSRVEVREADAREGLGSLSPPPDVVLVDPMFPERAKAAKARREMQLLQQLLGAGDDAVSLLEVALAVARERVVVKRPMHAPHVGGRRPNHAVEGRAARYDVYLTGPGAGRS